MLFSGVQDITFLNLAKASIFELDSKILICADIINCDSILTNRITLTAPPK